MARMTHNTLLVLRALMAEPGREMYGLEVMRAISLKSGTVYPLLDRAEAAGWVKARAEKIDAQHEGRPPRKYYSVTPEGTAAAREAMERETGSLAALGIAKRAPEAMPPLSIGGIKIPLIVDDGQPPGTVTAVSRGLDRDGNPFADVRHMVNVAPSEPEPERAPATCKHKGLRLSKGVCPDCMTYVAKK